MSTSDPTPPPPATEPQHHPAQPQPMLNTRPGGPTPPWVIWAAVVGTIVPFLFAGLYVLVLLLLES
ncbi:hypothetical protein [Aeromicrobium alkaliterrae]|uniref:Uncharacterized protein n=1 Tax=Aeromicrobium alkaliterrae TaxID=302168 RepID=A0ABN2JGC4_9ACTN